MKGDIASAIARVRALNLSYGSPALLEDFNKALQARAYVKGDEMKTIRIAEMDYDAAAAIDLMGEVIALRDMALQKTNFKDAVRLSHVVAFMAIAIPRIFKEGE